MEPEADTTSKDEVTVCLFGDEPVELEEQASKEKDEDQKNDIEAKKSVIGRRMDELTEMLVKEGETNDVNKNS